MKMAHVTIMTKCLDDSVQFYQDIVGLKIQRDMRENPAHKIVFLGNEKGETCVELVENLQGAYSGEGISMGFEVDDAAGYHRALEEKGLQPGEMIFPNPHAKFFFVTDPNGVRIQFVEED